MTNQFLDFSIHLSVQTDDSKQHFVNEKLEHIETDFLKIKPLFSFEEDALRISVQIQFLKKCNIISNSITSKFPIPQDAKIGCNGYQSWTESREFATHEKMKPLRNFAHNILKPYGDYGFVNYGNTAGKFHSWNFAYINQLESPLFIGSLNEKQAYTKINIDCKKNEISIEKDWNEIWYENETLLLEVLFIQKLSYEAFQKYHSALNLVEKPATQVKGYTSWYLHYTSINPSILQDNLNEYVAHNIDYFQIDDGWQNAVGDWLRVNKNFKDGMAKMAESIHEKKVKAGLWLAPLVCEKNSFIYREKKDWILKDEKGKLIKAGYNPMWSGFFYALDLDNAAVKSYLEKVFRTIIEEWKFDLLKIDFLYASAIVHANGKPRAQRMYEAMTFIKKISEGAKLLGCGVPLASAVGLVDYCRIGADIHLSWEHGFLKFLRNRERVSTILSLQNSIFRAPLSGFWFYNDPDVIILRDEKNKLSNIEKNTIALVNYLTGDVIFSSDDIAKLSEMQKEKFKRIYKLPKPYLKSISSNNHIVEIHGKIENNSFAFYINLTEKMQNIQPIYKYTLLHENYSQTLLPRQAILFTETEMKF